MATQDQQNFVFEVRKLMTNLDIIRDKMVDWRKKYDALGGVSDPYVDSDTFDECANANPAISPMTFSDMLFFATTCEQFNNFLSNVAPV